PDGRAGGELLQGRHHRAGTGDGDGFLVGLGGDGGAEDELGGFQGQVLGLGGPQGGRPLDQHVAEGAGAAGGGPEDVAGQLAPAGAGIDDQDGSGRPRSSHHPSAARATSAPNSDPTSTLVRK